MALTGALVSNSATTIKKKHEWTKQDLENLDARLNTSSRIDKWMQTKSLDVLHDMSHFASKEGVDGLVFLVFSEQRRRLVNQNPPPPERLARQLKTMASCWRSWGLDWARTGNLAAVKNLYDKLNFLSEAEKNKVWRSGPGRSPLDIAALSGFAEVVDFLSRDFPCQSNDSALQQALSAHQVAVVAVLLPKVRCDILSNLPHDQAKAYPSSIWDVLVSHTPSPEIAFSKMFPRGQLVNPKVRESVSPFGKGCAVTPDLINSLDQVWDRLSLNQKTSLNDLDPEYVNHVWNFFSHFDIAPHAPLATARLCRMKIWDEIQAGSFDLERDASSPRLKKM